MLIDIKFDEKYIQDLVANRIKINILKILNGEKIDNEINGIINDSFNKNLISEEIEKKVKSEVLKFADEILESDENKIRIKKKVINSIKDNIIEFNKEIIEEQLKDLDFKELVKESVKEKLDTYGYSTFDLNDLLHDVRAYQKHLQHEREEKKKIKGVTNERDRI